MSGRSLPLGPAAGPSKAGHARQPRRPGRGAGVRRLVAEWRRASARLQTLANVDELPEALRAEADALRRQCEGMAATFGRIGAARGTGDDVAARRPHRR